MLAEYHRSVLLAARTFWRLVLRERVDFLEMLRVLRRMEMMEAMADKTYRIALEK